MLVSSTRDFIYFARLCCGLDSNSLLTDSLYKIEPTFLTFHFKIIPLLVRGRVLIDVENSKTFSISSKIAAADAGAAPGSVAAVLKGIEKVYEFSARAKPQIIVVTDVWLYLA